MLKKFLLPFFALLFIAMPALDVLASFDYTPMEKIPGVTTDGNFCNYISAVYKFGIWVIGICAMFMIIIGGYMYIMSAGNNASMGKAKGVIFDAIVGLLLAFFSYLILYEINPDLTQINGICGTKGGGAATGGGAPTTPTKPGETPPTTGTPVKLGSLSPACDKYDSQFNSAAPDKETQCLLKGIAMQESGCNSNVGGSNKGAYGLMQIKPDTAGMSASELSDPEKSIKKAAELLKSNQSQLNSYTKFPTSKQTTPGTEKVTFPDGGSYYTGNDDLIASYNGGGGAKAGEGKLGPFAESQACKGRAGYPESMPAWQCPYFADGSVEGEGVHKNNPNKQGYKETRDYVQKVQNYQKQCLAK